MSGGAAGLTRWAWVPALVAALALGSLAERTSGLGLPMAAGDLLAGVSLVAGGVAFSTAALAERSASSGTTSPPSEGTTTGSETPAESAAAAQARIEPLLRAPEAITVTDPLPAVPEPGVSVYWVTPNLQSQQPNTDALEAATSALDW